MNSNESTKGDILKATHRALNKGYHYIIYYEGNSILNFCGFMITRSNKHDNILMDSTHFENNDETGKLFQVRFDNTHLVRGKFLKSEEWGPFEKVGQLSEKGIDFLQNTVCNLEPETFRDYFIRNKLLS